MRRYLFYFVIGMLTFLVGVYSFAYLGWPSYEIPVTTDYVVTANFEPFQDETVSDENDTVIDEDEMAFEVLQPTIQKWLRGEKIKNEFTDPSNKSTEEITGRNISELNESDKSWLWSFRFEPTLIDVNGDGSNELAIRTQCAPVGNCQFWLFKRDDKGYRVLLKSLGGAVQTFKMLHNRTNGFFDLETRDHGDAWSGGIYIFKYDGKKYKISQCSTYTYSNLKDGKLVELKKPIIKSVDCYDE